MADEHDYVLQLIASDGSTSFSNPLNTLEIMVPGPQGPPGPVLLIDHGASVPSNTPAGTIIFEKDA